LAATKGRERKVGSLFVLLAILACGAAIFAVIPLQADHAHGHAAAHSAVEEDGSLPLMTVEITNPFGGDDHAHEIGLHDFPPGHPARRAMREAAARHA
jgi:hypothetical protein